MKIINFLRNQYCWEIWKERAKKEYGLSYSGNECTVRRPGPDHHIESIENLSSH